MTRTALPMPPIAARRPTRRTCHGVTLVDEYAWLRDPAYPEVRAPEILAHLEAENAYFAAMLKPHRPLVSRLLAELRGRLKPDDEGVPYREGDFVYQWRFAAGDEYRRWFRRPATDGDWTCFLDEPALAADGDYFRLGGFAVSRDGRFCAYAVDRDGSERFTIEIRDLESGDLLPERIPGTIGAPLWAGDGDTLLYRPVNDQWRPYAVRAHRLGTAVARDVTLYEESDSGFFVHLDETQSRQFIIIASADHETSEIRLLPAADPRAGARLVAPRQRGHEYEIDHAAGRFFIRSNRDDPDFAVFTAPEEDASIAQWRTWIAGAPGLYVRDIIAFRDFLAVAERHGGLDRVRIRHHDGTEHLVEFAESVYSVAFGTNREYATDSLRLAYESMVTPPSVYDYDVRQRRLERRKLQVIPSGHDPALYESERLDVPGRDGTRIPVSIVWRREEGGKGPRPLHLYGYGAYGLGIAPGFSTNRLSLLDRGFVSAIAHVRGGDELGRTWYEAGKGPRRWNSFHDFIDVAQHLVASGRTRAGDIVIAGGSAGGTLMGVAANERPDLWRAVIAHVPFVDVLNTMLDQSLPLTPIEWPEWGNPITDADAFRLILGYSPYENVRRQAYPAMFVTAGLHDPRVTYWEPAKWVAKLRATKTDSNPILLRINMEAGHGGKSGRFRALMETAEEYAFILSLFSHRPPARS
ncbi:MAG: S9 family peptidase [Alphaproteobacteria bacterium]|nr:MAG: S9 family peptidase [Alphaproteobacteria bacterium]